MLTHNNRFLKMALYISNISVLAVFWHRLVKTKKYNLQIHMTQLLTKAEKYWSWKVNLIWKLTTIRPAQVFLWQL